MSNLFGNHIVGFPTRRLIYNTDVGETLEEEKSSSSKPRKVDRLWDRVVEMIYDTFDDFTVEPRHDDQPEVIEPLNMKM